ncbi:MULTISPECIES: hypothetical protein [Pseudomonas syringae group]|uniref:Uncharacterized protein n=4 Tax=Pseudomonas syringae group TaxID=136849 RepID=A0AA40TXJ6_9PSED|nr:MULTISPECIES: hypothetical protein [Pseudomonas syringae group]KGS15233.1 hypothetical protein OA77_06870 [Pseudomonas coronafaciens]KOP57615.1 hypothetical protein OX88_04670 [Pseudomonas coronafaciens pv. porri]KOP60514.1 hypothetical protein OX90_05265 [Pseudomonas coronafaciens pv. porri]KPB55628.1 Uncharacterized protein AC511_4339 [Pseudomonas coronafaciens pv. oryzae]KPX30987.1 Uncharacterized protein ALO77_03667 [Pseudomonas coronafaciens pv. garcae]
MKQTRSSKHFSPDGELGNALTDAVFVNGLRAFEAQALLARRGFQVVMAAKVFGVGTLLDNNLPRR